MPSQSLTPNTLPVIETRRLRLRGHQIADFDACAAMWSDPDVTRFIGGRPSTREETWSRLLRYAGLWALLGFGFWAVEDRADGRFVGEVGFGDFRRDIKPSMDGLPEMGWAFMPTAHGQGYASEAVEGALAWIATRFSRIACIISPENLPSIRVARKAGFREIAHTLYRGDPTTLYWRDF